MALFNTGFVFLSSGFSSSSLSCDGGLTLVCSKNELNNKYKVQVLASKGVSTNDTGLK